MKVVTRRRSDNFNCMFILSKILCNCYHRSMPKLYQPLLRAQLIKLENAFQPGFSTITWTSLEIPAYCEHIEKVLTEVDLFVKEVILCQCIH